MFEVNEKKNVVLDSEHYDGATLRDVYGENYRPEGNKPHFIETRVFLQQVRDENYDLNLCIRLGLYGGNSSFYCRFTIISRNNYRN